MTAQEKLEVLQNTLWDVIQSQDGLHPAYERNQVESLKAAIFALEKQIPKKPHKIYEKLNVKWCECGCYLGELKDEQNYCRRCGQALDWSDYCE